MLRSYLGKFWSLPAFILAIGLCTLSAQNSEGPLLRPNGNWRVGRASIQVEDSTRVMPNSGGPRRLMLHIWYPTGSANTGMLPYMEGVEAARTALTSDELNLLKSVRPHSSALPPASPPASSRFSVLLFSHGEQMNAFLYSNLHEDLASHGYVIIGVDHPGAALFTAYPDRSFVSYSEPGPDLRDRVADRSADLRFVRDHIGTLEVRGRKLSDLVSERVGVFGHSLGGISAGLMCQRAPFFDACLNMDGRLEAAPILTGPSISVPSRPFMYVTKPFRTLTESELHAEGITRQQATSGQAAAWARDGILLTGAGPPSYRVTLRQAEHESFSDESLLRNPQDESRLKLMRTLRALLLAFFDSSLGDRKPSSVQSRNDSDVEIEVLAKPRTP